MGGYSSEFKVGLFTLMGLAVLAFFLLNTRDAPFGLGKDYRVYTIVPSAEGIQFGSMVLMAGVRVGRVGEITLNEAGQARVTLELDEEVKLPADSKTTLKTMGMLGDKTVHLLPGVSEQVLPPGSAVPYAPATGDLEQLTGQVSRVADDIKAITADLKAVTGKLRETTDAGQGWTNAVLGSSQSAQLVDILANLEGFTAKLNRIGGSSEDEVSEILRNVRDVSRSLKELVDSNRAVLEGSGRQVNEQIASLKDATVRLNDVLASANRIVEKVERGEGSVGALLNDPTTVNNLNDTISGANELLEKVNRFRTTVTYRGDFYAVGDAEVAGSMKNTLAVTLADREDYYYHLELVSDPHLDGTITRIVDPYSGRSATRITYTDAYQFSFQFARRWRDLALRLGLRENHGGVGADYFLFKDRVALAVDLYDFSSQPLPNLELRARVNVYNRLYLSAGLDNVMNRYQQGGINLFLGGGFSFRDDDLKYLLSFVPIP